MARNQTEIKGTERPTDDALDELIKEHRKHLEARMAAGKKEAAVKLEIDEYMKENRKNFDKDPDGQPCYVWDGFNYWLEAGDESLKFKKRTAENENDAGEIG